MNFCNDFITIVAFTTFKMSSKTKGSDLIEYTSHMVQRVFYGDCYCHNRDKSYHIDCQKCVDELGTYIRRLEEALLHVKYEVNVSETNLKKFTICERCYITSYNESNESISIIECASCKKTVCNECVSMTMYSCDICKAYYCSIHECDNFIKTKDNSIKICSKACAKNMVKNFSDLPQHLILLFLFGSGKIDTKKRHHSQQ